MRNWVRYAAGFIAALATLTAIARAVRGPAEEPRTRELDAEAVRKATTVRIDEAKAFSLWSGGRIVECLAPAHYAGAANGARFGAVMRLARAGEALAPAVFELAALPLRHTRIAVASVEEAAPNVVKFVPASTPRVKVSRSANSPGLELAALLAA
ncbi:MAG: hypothetical protein WDN76_09235 [Alphaproteobacteria bacterium]